MEYKNGDIMNKSLGSIVGLLCTCTYFAHIHTEIVYTHARDFELPITKAFLANYKKPQGSLFIHTENDSESRAQVIASIRNMVSTFIKKKNSTLGIRNKDVDSIAKNIESLTSSLINTTHLFAEGFNKSTDEEQDKKVYSKTLEQLGKLRKDYAVEKKRAAKIISSILTTKSSKELLELLQIFATNAISFIEKFAYELDNSSAILEGLK
jgi:hypothetical protein